MYDAIVRIVDQRVGEIKVTREGFDKLTQAVRELADAQKKTELEISKQGERITSLEAGVGRLEEAQKRTEETVRELGEAQKRTDQSLRELSESQKQTDQSLRELSESQKQTDQRLQKLAEAVQELTEVQRGTDTAVGTLTDTIGHDLESVARVNVPDWLRLYEGVKVSELERRVFSADGVEVEVDLYGEGMKGKTPTTVIGEVKSTIHGRDVETFSARANRLKTQLKGQIVKVMFGYWIHPSAEEEARKLQIHVIAPPGTYPTPKPARKRKTR